MRPASLQAPSKHQVLTHSVLGIPMHKIVCRTKRIGGGFGGKETRSAFIQASVVVSRHTSTVGILGILGKLVNAANPGCT